MTILTHIEATQLLAVMLDALARDVGSRALLIKGSVTQHHGIRPPRASQDLDLLVEPKGLEPMLDALTSMGWKDPRSNHPAVARAPHSVALQHERWPIELDLHSRYPGFLAPADEVFDALWAERVPIVQAGVSIPCTGPAGSLLIAILHSLRRPARHRHRTELQRAVSFLRDSQGELRSRIRDLARQTGADFATPDVVAILGPAAADHSRAVPDQLVEWRLDREEAEPVAAAWLAEIQRARWLRRPAIALRALLGSSHRGLRVHHPDAPPGKVGLWIARWRRLRGAVPELRRAYTALAREQRRLR